MYDCLMKAILANFETLEDLTERSLDTTVLKNRLVLSLPQINKSLVIFKKCSRYIFNYSARIPSLNFQSIAFDSNRLLSSTPISNEKCSSFSTIMWSRSPLVVSSIFSISSLMSSSSFIQKAGKGKNRLQSYQIIRRRKITKTRFNQRNCHQGQQQRRRKSSCKIIEKSCEEKRKEKSRGRGGRSCCCSCLR